MRAMRQIEAVELMIAAANVTGSYAKVLLAGIRQGDLVSPEKTKKVIDIDPERIERMQREMEAVQTDFKAVETTYGANVLRLVVATGYLGRLIQNEQIRRYWKKTTLNFCLDSCRSYARPLLIRTKHCCIPTQAVMTRYQAPNSVFPLASREIHPTEVERSGDLKQPPTGRQVANRAGCMKRRQYF